MLDHTCPYCNAWEQTGQVLCGVHRPDLDDPPHDPRVELRDRLAIMAFLEECYAA